MGEIHVMREGFLPPKQPPRRHLISIGDLEREDVERLLATAKSFSRSLEREVKKLPTLRGRTVVNVFYESSTRTSSSFELAAKRLSADTMSIKAARLVGGQGRVAEGHGADARRLRPGRDRDPAPADRRAAAGRALHRRARRQRRRRQAPAPDAGAARPLHDPGGARPDRGRPRGDRRRRAPLAGRALERPGAGADGREGDARRAAAADPARDRGDGLRGLARDRRDRRRGRRLRPAHAARADGRGRQLRALAARVHRALGRDARADPRRPEGDAPRPDEPRRRDRPAGRRRRRRADRGAGARRPRRADGGALRPAHDRAGRRSRPPSRWRWPDAVRQGTAARTTSSFAARACSTRSRAWTRCSTSASTRARSPRSARGSTRTATAWSTAPGSCSRRPSSTRTCTCACRAARTRRRSPPAPRPPRPAATARSSRCRTPIRSSTRPRCSAR